MADDAIDFASMMVSRLCHDLLSPVGSFGNGLELLADEHDAEMQKRCVELLESSARVAINRLKYFRLAFGSAGGYGDAIAAADIREALMGLVPEGRSVELNWIGGETAVPKSAARLLLLFGMVIVDALVRGGRIDMAIEQRGASLELAVRGAGDRLVIDPASEASFAGAGEPLAPKTVPIELARRIAQERGGDIMMSRPAATELVLGAIINAS